MAYQILSTGAAIFDNRGFAVPFNFELQIERILQIPEGAWFISGGIELQLQIFFSSTFEPDNPDDPIAIRNGTERFLNPTQRQIGYWAASSEGFVVTDNRIKYDKEGHSYSYPRIELSNTLNNVPQVMRLTGFTRESHAQTISPVAICGSTLGITNPPPAPTQYNIDAAIGDGGICMRVLPGQSEYAEIDRFSNIVPKTLQIDTKELLAPDLISGVVYGGYRLECSYQWGYHQDVCSGVVIPSNTILTGGAPFTPVTYTCVAGEIIPFTPLECPLGQLVPELITNADGTVRYNLVCSDNDV